MASIRARLILLVLSVLAPALAAGLGVVALTYQTEREGLEGNLRDTTRALSQVLERELAQREAVARQLSMSPLLAADPRQFEEHARRATQGIEGSVRVTSAAGIVLDTGPAARAGQSRGPPSLVDVPTLTPMQPDAATGVLQAAAIWPVVRDGKTEFNIAVSVLPRELQRIVDDQRLPAGWISAIVDSRGAVVARLPAGQAFERQGMADALRTHLKRLAEGHFETAADQQAPAMAAYFSTSAPSGWSYVVAVPTAQLGSSLWRSLVPVLAGIALSTAVAVLGALWVSRSIAGPVDRLSADARDLAQRSPVRRTVMPIRELDDVNATMVAASQALRQSHEELERQVEEAVQRTREAERRVSQSQRLEALGRLTGGVAHDFNNLLGVISNSTHVLNLLPAGAGRDAASAAILRAVETGGRLTQHLLRFAGRQAVRPERVDTRDFLPRTSALVKAVLGAAIRVELDVDPTTDDVVVDASELELALVNLVINARDAMPSGGTLRLSMHNATSDDLPPGSDGRFVRLSVADTGVGIDPAVALRIFEPFFTTKEPGQGSGLGLAQVHGFCRQAGGMALVSSLPGAGTTVSMLLPASPLAIERVPIPGAPATDGKDRQGEGCRLLLVEDNDDLGDVSAALLASLGFTVERARDGEEALRVLASGAPPVDVVLSDVVMPGAVDGLVLARRLRERQPPIPVVLISAFSAATEQHEVPVLPKPCPPADLLAALQRELGRARQAAVAAGTH